jgi:hypothetical protein
MLRVLHTMKPNSLAAHDDKIVNGVRTPLETFADFSLLFSLSVPSVQSL